MYIETWTLNKVLDLAVPLPELAFPNLANQVDPPFIWARLCHFFTSRPVAET